MTGDLAALLDGTADERTREHWTRYLKGTARFRGVPMAGVRTAVRTVVRRHALPARTPDELLVLASCWFAGDFSEEKLAAVLLTAEHLAGRLEGHHLDALAHPLARGDVADWNVCDWYGTKALHAFVTARPAELPARARALAGWCGAPGLWQRRAGLVGLVKLAPGGDDVFPGFVDLLLGACAANLVDPDRFAHTGPGWVLRELSRAAPEAVSAFVEEHPGLSPEARRMATARLRSGPYRRR
ncbi:DNA alkylation repair protein [Kineococcus sp. NUM-3379]